MRSFAEPAQGQAPAQLLRHQAQRELRRMTPVLLNKGTWHPNGESPNSGGDAVLTNQKGARAAITFNGIGITWIGVADQYSGVAQVYLDGNLSTIDTYAQNTKIPDPSLADPRSRSARQVVSLSLPVLHAFDATSSGCLTLWVRS
jgi:hypothetical protein